MDPSLLRHYHALNVFTIEDLSLVSDLGLQNLGPVRGNSAGPHRNAVEARKPAQATDPQLLDLVARTNARLDSQQATIEKLMEEERQAQSGEEKAGPEEESGPAAGGVNVTAHDLPAPLQRAAGFPAPGSIVGSQDDTGIGCCSPPE